MGCGNSKKNSGATTPSVRSHLGANGSDRSKIVSIKARLLESIKRQDLILLEKTFLHYNAQATEILGPPEQKKNVLHYIAEYNFFQGMRLLLEFEKSSKNACSQKDSLGYTPLMYTIKQASLETLEIMSQFDGIEIGTKSSSGKTALEMAKDFEDAYADLLQNYKPKYKISNVTMINSVRAAPKDGSEQVQSQNSTSVPTQHSLNLRSLTSVGKERSKIHKDSRLTNFLKQHKNEFIDDEFPHDELSNVSQNDVSIFTQKFPKMKWQKASKIVPSNEEVFLFDTFELPIVQNSPLYGCDLYGALAVMSEYPSRLLSTFTTYEPNTVGAYSVKFLVSGIPLEIMLDDYFPCNADEPIYSRPITSEFWFSLLEKGFAKLYGNYSDIPSVYYADAMEVLTGMPSTQRPLKGALEEDLWPDLLDFDRRNYILALGKSKESVSANQNRIFPVVGIFEVEDRKILKLRNPWEDFKWKGTFSDNSSAWTKKLKEHVGYSKGETSAFYVDISEVVENFDFLGVTYYHEGLLRNRQDVESHHKEATFFKLEVDREMECFLSVHQKLPRFVNESEGYEISPVEIVIAEDLDQSLIKITGGEKDGITCKQTVYAHNKIRMKLLEGKYIVRVKVKWLDQATHEYTLNTLSPKPVELSKIDSNLYPKFLNRVYLDAGRKLKDRWQLGHSCEFGSGWVGSHIFLYLVNNGDSKWTCEITFEKLEGLRLAKPFRTSDTSVKVVIPPKSNAVTWAKRTGEGTVAIKWKFDNDWELISNPIQN